jgi:hypothetical protein
MDNPREIAALEQRVGFLEDQRRQWQLKSYDAWFEKLKKIEAYDKRLHGLMQAHPELREAWDGFVCLYQLAVNKPLYAEATEARSNGCYLCWNEQEAAEAEREDRQRRRLS